MLQLPVAVRLLNNLSNMQPSFTSRLSRLQQRTRNGKKFANTRRNSHSVFLDHNDNTAVEVGLAVGENLKKPWLDRGRSLISQSKNDHACELLSRGRQEITEIQIEG